MGERLRDRIKLWHITRDSDGDWGFFRNDKRHDFLDTGRIIQTKKDKF